MKILKYRLIPHFPEEVEFNTTKFTVNTIEYSSHTDDCGNAINNRVPPVCSSRTEEWIESVSLPSGQPATVEVLEYLDDDGVPVDAASLPPSSRPKYTGIEISKMLNEAKHLTRGTSINLREAMGE